VPPRSGPGGSVISGPSGRTAMVFTNFGTIIEPLEFAGDADIEASNMTDRGSKSRANVCNLASSLVSAAMQPTDGEALSPSMPADAGAKAAPVAIHEQNKILKTCDTALSPASSRFQPNGPAL